MIRKEYRVSIAKILIAILLVNMFLFQTMTISQAENIFKQNGEAGQGGFQSGGYDNNAIQATAYNWVRQSGFSGPTVAEENWAVEFPGKQDWNAVNSMVIGSDNTIYMVVGGTLFYFVEGNPTQAKDFSLSSGPFLSSPVIGANGLLYIGGEGKMFAIDINDLTDGLSQDKLAWTYVSDDSTERFVNPPAIGADGTIYFPSNKGVLYALAENGSLKWKFVSPNAFPNPFLTPIIDENGFIYVTETGYSNATIYALDGDSQLIHNLDLSRGVHTPVISSDGLIYAPSRGKDIYVIDTDSFIQQTVTSATYTATTSDGRSITSSAAIGMDGKLYVTGYGRLYELDPTVFQDVYTNDTMNLVFNSGSGNETAPPLLDKDGNIYVVELREGIIYRFEKDETAPTGWSKTWEFINNKLIFDDYGEVNNYFYYSSPTIDFNGNLLVASYYRYFDTSMLFSIGPDTTGPFPEYSRNLWFESPVWVKDDKIFLLFNEELDVNFPPDPTAFSVTDHGNTINVANIEFTDNEFLSDPFALIPTGPDPNTVLVLNLEQKVINGQQVLISYQSDSLLQDLSGNSALSFSDVVVFDMTNPEIIDGQVIDGNILLTFDEEIGFNFNSSRLSTDKNLTVFRNGIEADIQNITTNEASMTIQLDSSVLQTDSLKIFYDSRGITLFDSSNEENVIRDTNLLYYYVVLGGNPAYSFTEYPITLWSNDNANIIEGNIEPGDIVTYSTDNQSSWQSYEFNNPVKFTGDQMVYVRVNEGTSKKITFTQQLDSLTVNTGTLTPVFDPAVQNYTVTVGSNVSEIMITVTANDNDTLITMNDETYTSGVAQTIALQQGLNDASIVLTAENAPPKTYTFQITRTQIQPNDNNSGGKTEPDQSSNKDISIIVDGEQKSINLDEIEAKNGEFLLEIRDDSPRTEIMIPVDVIKQWKNNYPNGVIHFKTPRATYVLPFGEMNLEELLKNSTDTEAQGEENYVKVTIAIATDEEKETVTSTADRLGVQTIGEPIDFSVEIVKDGDSIIWVPGGEVITDGDQNTQLKSFSGYILRSIYVNEDIDSTKTVVVLYDPVSKDFYPVPTRTVQLEDGRLEVIFQRPSNSMYMVINYEKKFKDIEKHWAEEDIQILANKLLVKGRTEDRFDPNGSITRAEFVTLLVRALGLQGLETAKDMNFTDTPNTSWYYQDLNVAVHSRLIYGYEDQTFRPLNKITREEMVMMLNRSLAFIGEDNSVMNAEQVLAKFTDSNDISSFAKNDMTSMINKGLIYGKGNNELAPKDYATRAESVAIIKRFLKYVKFL